MPRDGSQIYHRPPGTDGIPDTTIASTPYNSYVADVEQDLNLPRPIVAGGTGATNARDAMTSLQGDVAYQIVTNYDSYPFISGSFYSAAGATSAPVAGHAFVGVCYTSDPAVVPPAVPASLDLVIEARDQNDTTVPGRMYVREKKAGVWGAWAIDNAALEAEKVNRSGDTMTGNLTISASGSPGYVLNITDAGQGLFIASRHGLARWAMSWPDGSAETGGNAGSNFAIGRYDDSGAGLDSPLTISRASGVATFAQSVGVNGVVVAGAAGVTGTYQFGNTGTQYLTYSAGNYAFASGNLNVGGNVTAAANATQGTYFFGSSGTKYLYYDSANYTLAGGNLTVSGNITAAGASLISNGNIGLGWSAAKGACGVYFGNNSGQALTYDGNNYALNGGNLTLGGSLTVAAISSGGNISAGGGVQSTGAVTVNNGVVYLNAAQDKYLWANAGASAYQFQTWPVSATALYAAGGSLSAINSPLKVGYAGGGTQYGASFRPATDDTIIEWFENAAATGVGSIKESSTGVSYNTSSDGRLKEDLKSFDAGGIVDSTNVYDFAWKTTGERSYGIIAQQAIDVYPAAVTYAKEQDWYGIDYSKYVPVLLQELKALRARVAQLESKLAA